MRLLAVALIGGTFLNVNAMNNDMKVVENLIEAGTLTNKIFTLYKNNQGMERMESEYVKEASDSSAKAAENFRSHNQNNGQLTIKKLRESTYDFLHKNGLDYLYDNLAIGVLEIQNYEEVVQNHEDKRIKCIIEDDGRFVIKTDYSDYVSARNLFHNEEYNNISIGGQWTHYNLPECSSCCNFISMERVIEGYENVFIHESGHYYQSLKYSVFDDIYNRMYNIKKKDAIMYVVSETFAWTFEFRHAIEMQLDKDYIFQLGIRLPILFGNSVERIPYYFMNLSLSLANQPEKKLVDIADKLIDEIKTRVIIDGYDVRTEFTCDSNASPDEYGIDVNGVIRFNAEKNKAAIRDLITRMGYDPDAVFERVKINI